MAASALPETLKSITATKIQEVTNQRNIFEAAKAEIYKKASTSTTPLETTLNLFNGVRQLRKIRLLSDDSSDDDEYQSHGVAAEKFRNDSLLLRQAATDPSAPASVIASIQKSLERDLEIESIKHQHAQFFSELVTEWLKNPDHEVKTPDSSSFESIGRKEMHEQRATWESLVFTEAKVEVPKIEAYLKKLFTPTKVTNEAYKEIVRCTKAYSSELRETKDLFDSDSLKGTMAGLAKTDLLTEEKNATLRAFMANKEVLKEVADVLNMRFMSLKTWTWTVVGDGIPVEMRRQLNGKYRVFMDEDILDALLIYEIGLKWAVHFRTTLTRFFDSPAWSRSEKQIPKVDRQRREYYLVNDAAVGADSMQKTRRTTYREDYLLTQLPISESVGKRNYDEDNDDDDDEAVKQKGPLDLKHGLLHMLVAESLIARHLKPQAVHTVIRSDFKWFGPAMPHATVYAVLQFFGVDEEWLVFFRKFLEAPLFFVQDGPQAQTQTRKRGLAMSHTLTDVFGEVVLFVMDYAVNQATSSYLYRLHDDFWLWGSEESCLKGWKAMTSFAGVMGIEFNQEKTGTVRIGKTVEDDSSEMDTSDEELSTYSSKAVALPRGEVRWGFLLLDAQTGQFLVDQKQVDEHIAELRTQLSYCKSIFSYIQSYNAYVGRFFTNNFGKPSYGFGRKHVDMMISTFARIQKEMFPSGSVTDHLTSLAHERFGIQNLPQGFWYFPIEQGGLELRNPLIPLLGMRESLRQTPDRLIEKALDKDEADYRRAETYFKDHNNGTGFGKIVPEIYQQISQSGETFMSKEEYLRYREEKSVHLAAVYKNFLMVPPEQEIMPTQQVTSLLAQGEPDLPTRFKNKQPALVKVFGNMQPYWKWMLALYGAEIVERYGSVRMVDGGQVPLGVVSLMKKNKVRWRG